MKTVIFDLDGTMYRGTAPIEAGIRAVQFLQEHNIPYMFLTNNSMRTPAENRIHMENMGYTGIRDEDFYNSAMASVEYVKRTCDKRKCWYIGEDGMKDALEKGGFVLDEENPDFVFVGLSRKADYALYSKALTYLLNGAVLIGTNMDRKLPSPTGFDVGNGSIVTMFEYASGQKSPDVAKPNAPILEYALDQAGINKNQAVIVGDNLETDIALGYNNGVETVFVQTGVHTDQDIDRLKVFPDHCVKSLDEVDWISLTQD